MLFELFLFCMHMSLRMASQSSLMFLRSDAITWIPKYTDKFYTKTPNHCVRQCSLIGYPQCIGVLVDHLTNSYTCTLLGKYFNDTLVEDISSSEVWYIPCPHGYMSIPASAIPPRCYKVILLQNGTNYATAKALCNEDGLGGYVIATETLVEMNQVYNHESINYRSGKYRSCWTGALEQSGAYIWEHSGLPINPEIWLPGRPGSSMKMRATLRFDNEGHIGLYDKGRGAKSTKCVICEI